MKTGWGAASWKDEGTPRGMNRLACFHSSSERWRLARQQCSQRPSSRFLDGQRGNRLQYAAIRILSRDLRMIVRRRDLDRECADFHEGGRAQVLRPVDLRVEVRCLRHSPALAVPLQVFENLARGVAAVDTADAAAGMGSGAAEVETPDGRPVIRVAGDGPP